MEKGKTTGKGVKGWLLSSTRTQARDTGMAMTLICLLLAYWGHHPKFLPLAIIILLVTMIVPQVFRPLAVLWFGLSHVMGNVVSKVVLSLIFFVVVTPIGLIRRWSGKDSLRLRQWKQNTDSVFVEREGIIVGKDLENPY